MTIAVVIPQKTIALTTLAEVKAELRITTADASRDSWLTDRVDEASRAIQDELDRPLTRHKVRERFDGTGRQLAVLERTPIAALYSLEHADLGVIDLTITDLGREEARIEDPDAGIIWRSRGFPDDSPRRVWLTIDTIAQPGAQPWQAIYMAGWLTRADDISASGVTASGSSLLLPDDSQDVMPLVVAGDVLRMKGWTSNRGRVTVTARSDTSITVAETFTTEVGGYGAVVEVRNAPGELERCAIETVRWWYYRQTQNPTTVAEHLGDWGATYLVRGEVERVLPAAVLGSLDRYRRLM